MNNISLATLVKEARLNKKISQRELTRRTGVDNNTISKIEKESFEKAFTQKVCEFEHSKEKVDYFTKIIEKVKEDEKVIFFISLINSIAELQEALREYKKKEQSLKNIINELDK